jgi:hypothetical protein
MQKASTAEKGMKKPAKAQHKKAKAAAPAAPAAK